MVEKAERGEFLQSLATLVEDGPELGRALLDGGTAEGDAAGGVEGLDGLSALGLRVLDPRGLVEDEEEEGLPGR